MSRSHQQQATYLPLILFITAIVTAPTNALDLPTWVDNMLPTPGSGTIEDEVKCYSLPYGGIGFTSHVLTYYTLVCLWSGRAPWWPAHRLDSWKLDLLLGMATLIITVGLSAFAMYRCKNSWPFILIATQKLLLSFSLSCTTIHRAIDVRRITRYGNEGTYVSYKEQEQADPEQPSRSTYQKVKYSAAPAGWISFYACGAVIGLVGDFALLVKVWPERTKAMNIVTGVFGGLVLLVALLMTVSMCCNQESLFGSVFAGLFGAAVAAGIVAALYGDWLLAAILVKQIGPSGWIGLPSSDIAPLYWTYFVFKRLPLFSF